MMQIRKAQRRVTKARVGMPGPSGSGKTLSALLIARGMTSNWEKVGLIDTENCSADLYAETTKAGVYIPKFPKIDIEPPYTTEKYVEAIQAFETHGVEVIIIDSLSQAWSGEGGLLEQKDRIAKTKGGNSFAAWSELTPKQNRFVEAILKSKCHVIATMRSKTEYVLDANERGKSVPKKVGMAPVQRDGLEYEFTLVLDLTADHVATVSKDRTGLFDGQYFTPSVETGQKLLEWLESGESLICKETKASIEQIWVELGHELENVNEPIQKMFSAPLDRISEKQAQEILTRLEAKKRKNANEEGA